MAAQAIQSNANGITTVSALSLSNHLSGMLMRKTVGRYPKNRAHAVHDRLR